MKRINNNTKGFSLVELAIGLAVVSVLILAISLSSGIRDNARIQAAANSIQSLRSAAESYISLGKLNYAGINVAALKLNNLLPANFNASQSNPWGGSYSLAPNSGNTTRFDIALTAVSVNDAAKLNSFFNNVANNIAYDSEAKTWVVTF